MARVIDQVLGATTSSVVGEITRELVNSSDGQGLHFDGAAGNIAGTTGLNLGSKYSAEFVLNYSGQSQSRLFDISGGGRVIIEFNRTGYTGKIVGYDSGWYAIADLFENDTTVHFVVTFDGTSVTAYVNGSQVGTATKNNSTEITSSQFAVGSSIPVYGSWFNGTIYRARFYNRTLSADDVRTAYQRADVPVADQYGSQTIVIPGDFDGDLDGWNSGNTWNSQTNPSNNMVLAASNTNQYCRTAVTLTKGFKYRVTYTASSITGSPFFAYAQGGAIAAIPATSGSTTITAGTKSAEFTLPDDANPTYFYIASGTASDAVTLDNVSVVRIGCVSDYDLAFANENQSRMVADRSTNNVDGEMSSSGVKQTQVIKQLNSTAMRVGGTSATAATPADGEIIADKVGAGIAPAVALHAKTSASTGTSPLEVARLEVKDEGLNMNAGMGPKLTFYTPHTDASFEGASIAAKKEDALDNNEATALVFSTCPDAGTNTERVNISSSGNVIVDGGGYVKIAPANTTAELRLYRDDSTINASGIAIGDINFGGADADNDNAARLRVKSDGAWTASSSPTAFEFQTCPSGSESLATRLVIASTGLATFSNGIAFSQTNTSATGASTVSSILDHYGRGLWTPTLVRNGAAISAGVAYSNQAGNYTRIGNVVYYWFDMTISTLDNSTLNPSSGTFGIGGLPFTSAASTAGGYGAPSFRSMTAIPTSIRNNNNSSFVQASSTYIALFWFNGSAAEIGLDTVTTDLTTGRLTGEGFYFTS